MKETAPNEIGQRNPTESWEALSGSGAALVDVRSRPEWSFVGVPDLGPVGKQAWLIEWRRYPDMAVNPEFIDQLMKAIGDAPPTDVLFICRSGARSQEAATVASAALRDRGMDIACWNVAEGFEGDLGVDGHRGGFNGWKARGLPWRQS